MTERDIPSRTPSERLKRKLAINAYRNIDSDFRCDDDQDSAPSTPTETDEKLAGYIISLDLMTGELVVSSSSSK